MVSVPLVVCHGLHGEPLILQGLVDHVDQCHAMTAATGLHLYEVSEEYEVFGTNGDGRKGRPHATSYPFDLMARRSCTVSMVRRVEEEASSTFLMISSER